MLLITSLSLSHKKTQVPQQQHTYIERRYNTWTPTESTL